MLCIETCDRTGASQQGGTRSFLLFSDRSNPLSIRQVCGVLGIVERDYFGLKHHSAHSGRVWLNLRNSIKLQLGQQPREPYVFDLRVKFFVSPSQLLQDKTR